MLENIISIINKFIPDPDQAAKAAIEIEKEATKRMQLRSEVILAEERNGSGRWRVRLMYLCMAMVSLHFVMYDIIPYLRTIFDWNFYTPEAPIDQEMWTFLQIGVGGYIGSRGVEKTVAHFRRK